MRVAGNGSKNACLHRSNHHFHASRTSAETNTYIQIKEERNDMEYGLASGTQIFVRHAQAAILRRFPRFRHTR